MHKPSGRLVATDERGNITINGRPFFPQEIYTLRNREDFAVAKACGFNAVIEQGEGVLDLALANGMRVTAPNWFALGYDGHAARRQVERLRSHRALLAWNLCDEPDLRANESPPSLIKEVSDLIRQLDSDHPTSVTCAGGAGARHWKELAEAVEIFRIDPYPVIASRPISEVARASREARRVTQGRKPVLVVLQAWVGGLADRLPSAEEDRCMTYMALIEGAKGISHFDFNVGTWQRSSGFWNGLIAMNLELRRIAPVLLEGRDEEVAISRGKVMGMAKRYKGCTYVFVANPERGVSEFTVTVPHAPVWNARTLFEDVLFRERPRKVTVDGRSFSDVLPGFGTAVYEVKHWPWQGSLADERALRIAVEPSGCVQVVRAMSRRHFIVKNVTDERLNVSVGWNTREEPCVYELDVAHRRMGRVEHGRRDGAIGFEVEPQTAYEIGRAADVVGEQLRTVAGRAEELLGAGETTAELRRSAHGSLRDEESRREIARGLLGAGQEVLGRFAGHFQAVPIAEDVFDAAAVIGDMRLTLKSAYPAGGGFNVPARRYRAFPGGRFWVDVGAAARPWVSVDEVEVQLVEQNGRAVTSTAVRAKNLSNSRLWLSVPQDVQLHADLIGEVTVRFSVDGQAGWLRRALRFAVEPAFGVDVEWRTGTDARQSSAVAGRVTVDSRFHGYPFGALSFRATGFPQGWTVELRRNIETDADSPRFGVEITCPVTRRSALQEVVSPCLNVFSGEQQVLSQPLPRMMVDQSGFIQVAGERPKEAVVVRGRPRVDGRLEDDCWQKANVMAGFMPVGESDFAARQTVARVCWDDRCLYVAAQCFGRAKAELRAEATKRDEPMPMDDVVELWLRPSGTSRLYCIKLNPNGVVYDAACEVAGESVDWKGDAGWNADLTVATMSREDGWQFEMAIPLSDLGVARIATGETWRANVVVARSVAPREVETWSYVSGWPPGLDELAALAFGSAE